MKLLTPAQMNVVDQEASRKYHIPSVLLMEHAANQVFKYLEKSLKEKAVAIICGPGNNGGDGLALARLLASFTNRKIKVYMMAAADKLTTDGRIYFEICKSLNVEMQQVTSENINEVKQELLQAECIVDAIFGTGLKRLVEGNYKEIIETVNGSMAQVVSIDIPSGIDGVTGKVQGICVAADVTITFMVPKTGLLLYPAIMYTGQLEVVNIGIPKLLIDEAPSHTFTIEPEEMAEILPRRPVRSNKGTFGKVLTIGGSLGMSGAISLTSLAAYKVGCGTVTSAVPRCIIEIMQQKLTETMALPMKDDGRFFHAEAAQDIANEIEKYHVIAVGPGIGRTKATLEILKVVLQSEKPCVVDADALYFIPEVLDILKDRKAPTLLTPHPGEMARMTNETIESILEDPIASARRFAKAFQVTVLLKIEKTVIVDCLDNIYINRYGNPGMAKGGSGDTLTGIVAGLLAQHLLPIDAARLGVYLQTKAADFAKEELSQYSYLASDTISYLGHVFRELETYK